MGAIAQRVTERIENEFALDFGHRAADERLGAGVDRCFVSATGLV